MNRHDFNLHDSESLIKLLATRQPNSKNWFNPCFEQEPAIEDIKIILMKIDAKCEKEKQMKQNQFNQINTWSVSKGRK